MSTIIGNQVNAFGTSVSNAHDAIMRAHQDAMFCQDIQEITTAGPAITRMVLNMVEKLHAKKDTNLDEMKYWAGRCETLLEALTMGRMLVTHIEDMGFVIDGKSEYADAVLDVRETLASLRDAAGAGPNAAEACSYSDCVETAKRNPPPQSWFNENHRKLHGPWNE